MYIARKNEAPNKEAVIEFIKKHSFAVVTSVVDKQITGVHIPLEINVEGEDIFLSGHVSISNSICEAIKGNKQALVIFSEPHAYISSSWYDHVNVPTWNYIAVHINGQFQQVDKTEMLKDIKQMVDKYEAGRKDRFHLEHMSEEMLDAHLNGLMAFKIKVNKVEANFKLSQNRKDKDYDNIIEKLTNTADPMNKNIAAEMRNIRPE